ncbi:thermostable hemolysin [Nonomuraea fuscirosea]|uniref:thermostable hemolysin n=1 Tax=Nonomuraea fuscirosea TaxID=1291556 RepID=UPI00342CD786
MNISLAPRGSAAWRGAVDLAKAQYRSAYGATISPDPDWFVLATREPISALPVAGEAIEIAACAGLTNGAGRELFSERYLTVPLEEAIEEAIGTSVARERVVEVGSLAGSGARAGFELIGLLPVISWCQGMDFILCTATPRVRTAMTRCEIPFRVLAEADVRRLEESERRRWGAYYDTRPLTVVIPLREIGQVFARVTGKYRFLHEGLLRSGARHVLEVARATPALGR